MADEMVIRTNNVPRPIIYGYELSAKERAEFDYYDWSEDGSGDNASFFRYKHQLYDLNEFSTTTRLPKFNPLRKWDGYMSDSLFSGIVVKWCRDYEFVVTGTFYA